MCVYTKTKMSSWTSVNKSLDESIFSNVRKIGSITSILKTGNRSLVSNYGPIRGHLSKVFESLVLDAIQRFFNCILDNE